MRPLESTVVAWAGVKYSSLASKTKMALATSWVLGRAAELGLSGSDPSEKSVEAQSLLRGQLPRLQLASDFNEASARLQAAEAREFAWLLCVA